MPLGCEHPLLLRPLSPAAKYNVVGPSFIPGMMDGEKFLGRLVKPWRLQLNFGSTGLALPCFYNDDTKTITGDDPRLPPLPRSWELTGRTHGQGDTESFREFRNTETGEVINYDPRMSPEALRERGVKLQTFVLV